MHLARLAGEPERLTTGADAHTISLSVDGRRLAYARFRTLSNIWSIPVPTSRAVSIAGARPVTTGDQTIETVDVSRDGRWLVFNSDRNGSWQIYKMPAAGGEAIQLTTDSAGAYSPAWSPDGHQIAFHSIRTGNRDLYTMAADGSGVIQRTSSPAHELDPALVARRTRSGRNGHPGRQEVRSYFDLPCRLDVYSRSAGWERNADHPGRQEISLTGHRPRI